DVVAVVRHQTGRVVVVGDEVQHRGEDEGDRLGEVDELSRLRGVEDRFGAAAVGFDDLRRGLPGQQVSAEGDGERFVVRVEHPEVPRVPDGDFVDVADRRGSGAEVDELPNTQ